MIDSENIVRPKIGKNVSLTFSIFIVVVVLTLTVVISVLGYFSVKKAILKNDKDLVSLEIKTIENLLQNYINHHAQVLMDYAESPVIINSSMNDMSDEQDKAALEDSLSEFKWIGKSADFTLIDVAGDVIGRSDRSRLISPKDEIVNGVLSGGVSHFFEFNKHQEDGVAIRFYVPVLYSGSPEGVLVAEMPVSLESVIFNDAITKKFQMLVYQKERIVFSGVDHAFKVFWEKSFSLPNSDATFVFRIDTTSHHDYLRFLGVKVLFLAISIMAIFLAVFRFVGQKLFVEPSELVLLAQKDTELVNSQLMKVNEDLTQFAYIASHDLKSPLLAITQLAGWIKEDCEEILPDQARKYIRLMQERIARMQKLLDDLLEYSRVGRYEYEFEEVDVESLAQSLFELNNSPESFRLEVVGRCDAWLMPSVPVEIVLRNLFSNAIKHHDKKHGNIKLECKESDGYYVLSVQDDGPGIDQELHKKAFEMFQTLKPRDEVEGSGMGLALIKKIVESYGGMVEIDSVVGEGTTITSYWPTRKK